MKRFINHKAGRGGWSKWIFPNMKSNYSMKCCDCGLVHEIQFKTGIKTEHNREKLITETSKFVSVFFRARRERK